jgi:hypothetical protein
MFTGPIGRHGKPAIVAESRVVETCAAIGDAPNTRAVAMTASDGVFTIGRTFRGFGRA